ncbi:MAG: hypothetical protein ACTSRZ_20995 [Promethearchaeota archaeon]
MIGNKLVRFLDSRFFTALLNITTIILLLIGFLIAKNQNSNLYPLSIVFFAVFSIICVTSIILTAAETGIRINTKTGGFSLDERELMLISGITFLIIASIHRYLNSVTLVATFWDLGISNLWISSAIIMIITGIQAIFVHRL